MDFVRIVAELDAEIEKLQRIRETLAAPSIVRSDVSLAAATNPAALEVRRGRGRPKGSKNERAKKPSAHPKKDSRLSAAARKRISDGMKKRWADRRNETKPSKKA